MLGCHNTHPDTPKNDWQSGEVRGILEVITPIQSDISVANDMIRNTLLMLVGVLVTCLFVIGLVLRSLRLNLHKAQELTNETNIANEALAKEINSRKQAEESLRVLSETDALTGIANRRKFDEYFDLEWRRARRNKKPIAIILADIDCFKFYNDNYGHMAGDQTLMQVAAVIDKTVFRATDLLARYGGEEFIVVLPDTDLTGASIVAENMRANIESRKISHEFSNIAKIVTISIGVAVKIPESELDSGKLVTEADKALYFAKKSGRNCVKDRAEQAISVIKKNP